MKFRIKDLSSKCDQIRMKLRIWSHLLKKSLMKNFIFVQSCLTLETKYVDDPLRFFVTKSILEKQCNLRKPSFWCYLDIKSILWNVNS